MIENNVVFQAQEEALSACSGNVVSAQPSKKWDEEKKKGVWSIPFKFSGGESYEKEFTNLTDEQFREAFEEFAEWVHRIRENDPKSLYK